MDCEEIRVDVREMTAEEINKEKGEKNERRKKRKD